MQKLKPTKKTIQVVVTCKYCQKKPENMNEFWELFALGYHLSCQKDFNEMEEEKENHVRSDIQTMVLGGLVFYKGDI